MVKALDDLLQFHQSALNLRTHRQQILASNIANADTPHYKAKDFNFSHALRDALAKDKSVNTTVLALTAPNHLQAKNVSNVAGAPLLYRIPAQSSIDSNTVDLDLERSNFADNVVHYEANLMFITGQIKTLLAAIQG